MPMQIRSSPKLRDRPSRKIDAENAKAELDARHGTRVLRPRGRRATRILLGAVALTLLVVAGNALWATIQGPDPHYLAARKLVLDYEYAKPEKDRNYDHVAYRRALEELDQVNPRSSSAEAAQALRMEIERKRTSFRERQEQIDQQVRVARAKTRTRKASESEARLRSMTLPVTEFPECETEEHNGTQKGHSH